MSVQPIIQSLKKITQLHESLLNISETKTESLKTGDIDQLQDLLKQERKHVQAINQLEAKRLELVGNWAKTNGLDPAQTTVSVMLESDKLGSEKATLADVTTQLAEVLVRLKQQEQLNEQLTQQSLQFVKLSLDMLAPTIDSINYGNQRGNTADETSKRSVFDSRA